MRTLIQSTNNLFKHTSPITLEKATKSVPEKTELVNQQQQPEPIKQTTPEQTSTSTQITQTQTTNSPQKAISEPVVETMVPESVQVTESEPSVTITASEPSQNPTNNQTINQTAINDQPSSSSTIQTNKPTNLHLLKSEFLEAEMMAMSAELQRLVQLRRSFSLTVDYQERWATLKARASELLDIVSLKCIKIQEAANLHHISSVHLVEDEGEKNTRRGGGGGGFIVL